MAFQAQPTGFSPTGALGGLFAGQNAAQAQEAAYLANQGSGLDNLVKEKEAAFAQDEMNNPALREARMAGIIGENQSKQAKGQFDMTTLPSKAKAEIAANITKASAEEINGTINELDKFIGLATSYGPAGLARAVQSLPPEMQQVVAELQQSGEDPVKYAQQIKQLIVEARSRTAESTAKERQDALKGEADHERAVVLEEMRNRATLQAANISAGARSGTEKATERVQYLTEVAYGIKKDPNITQDQAKAWLTGQNQQAIAKAGASQEAKTRGTFEVLKKFMPEAQAKQVAAELDGTPQAAGGGKGGPPTGVTLVSPGAQQLPPNQVGAAQQQPRNQFPGGEMLMPGLQHPRIQLDKDGFPIR